jgi:hypothetical protein
VHRCFARRRALVACAGVTVSAVTTAMGVKLRGGRVVAQGHWDAHGTLGVDREAPIGLTDIALTFELDTDADAATVQRLVEMSERFCVSFTKPSARRLDLQLPTGPQSGPDTHSPSSPAARRNAAKGVFACSPGICRRAPGGGGPRVRISLPPP